MTLLPPFKYFQMGYTKGGPHWKRKEEKKPHGGSRPKSGRKKEIGEDGLKVGEGGVAVGARKVKNIYNARKREESKARLLEAPAKKTKEEKIREENARRVVRLAGRIKLKTNNGEDSEAEEGMADDPQATDAEEDPEATLSEREGEDTDDEEDDSEEDETEEEEEDEDEHQDLTLEEDTVTGDSKQPSPGKDEKPGLGDEGELSEADVAELIATYKMRPGPARTEALKALSTSTFDRTRKGGKAYPLAFFYHPDVELHRDEQGELIPPPHGPSTHQERPERTRAIVALLKKEGLWDAAERHLSERRLVTKEEALLVHSDVRWAEIEELERMTFEERTKWGTLNEPANIFCCSDTSVAARLAAGGVLVGMDEIFLNGFIGVILVWIRPPGHHASQVAG